MAPHKHVWLERQRAGNVVIMACYCGGQKTLEGQTDITVMLGIEAPVYGGRRAVRVLPRTFQKRLGDYEW